MPRARRPGARTLRQIAIRERDARILLMLAAGQSAREVAAAWHLSTGRLYQIARAAKVQCATH